MGLLDELFRHKSALSRGPSAPEPGDGVQVVREPAAPRGLGAIAAAIGGQSEQSLPGEFEVLLGDLLQRAPAQCIWPGRHDPARVLWVPVADVAGGLARGRAEVSLARLLALAPDVFRWEPGDSEDPRVRLPLQKLLQQIGGHLPVSVPAPTPVAAPSSVPALGAEVAEVSGPPVETSEAIFGAETEVVSAHVAPIEFDAPGPAEVLPQPTVPPVEISPLTSPAAIKASISTALTEPLEAPHGQPSSEPEVLVDSAASQEVRGVEVDDFAESIPETVPTEPQTDVPISKTLTAEPEPPEAPHVQPPPEPNVILAPAAPQEVHRVEADPFADSIPKTVELRPQADVPISTTLRAVVLGSSALSAHGEGTPGSPILAPHYPEAASAATPVFLAPTPAGSPVAPAEPPAQPSPQEHPVRAFARSGGEPDLSALQSLFMTDDPLDVGAVAAHAAALPGVQACLITGARGTARAGQLPGGLDAEVVGALALELSGKVAESAARLNVGSVESTTVHRDDCAVAIFSHEGVCLTVVLGPRGFVAGVRQRLVRATELLAAAPSIP